MSLTIGRVKLEWFKYGLYLSVPLLFGYGLGRFPGFWERIQELHPSAATNPKGPYLPKELTAHRPSLHSEYQKIVLEEALDAAITDLRNKRREAAAAAGTPAAVPAPL